MTSVTILLKTLSPGVAPGLHLCLLHKVLETQGGIGILQVKMLEWVATPVSTGSPQPRRPGSPALQVNSLLSEPPTHILSY